MKSNKMEPQSPGLKYCAICHRAGNHAPVTPKNTTQAALNGYGTFRGDPCRDTDLYRNKQTENWHIIAEIFQL